MPEYYKSPHLPFINVCPLALPLQRSNHRPEITKHLNTNLSSFPQKELIKIMSWAELSSLFKYQRHCNFCKEFFTTQSGTKKYCEECAPKIKRFWVKDSQSKSRQKKGKAKNFQPKAL